jgi:hypothetical protein
MNTIRNSPARVRGYVMTEILIGAGLVVTLVAAVMVKAQTVEGQISANTIAEQMIAVRNAVSVAYAGQADYTGLGSDWKLLAPRLPGEMVTKDASGNVTGLRNALGGSIQFWTDNIMAVEVVGDPERRWCRDIVTQVAPVFGGAVNVWDSASMTYRTANRSPSGIDAACAGTGGYLIDVHFVTG